MDVRLKSGHLCIALVILGCLLAGCAGTARITDTLPAELEDRIEPLDTTSGVAFRFMPTPDAERIEINLRSISLPMNRVFSGMLTEMAQKKFGRIEPSSENGLEVAITYLNLEERVYMGSSALHRVEMEVTVEVTDREDTARREFVHAAEADLEGYSVRSDQIYDLLLHFVTTIDAFVNDHFREP